MAKRNVPGRRAIATRVCIAALATAAWAAVPAASAPAATGRAATGGGCSVATAGSLVQQGMPGYIQAPLDRVYCGPFLGPGSQAMVVVFGPQCGCGTVHFGGWDAFRLVDGAWTLGSDGVHDLPVFSISVQGTQVTEERTVGRRGDLFYWLPTGGRQARTWSWDGAAGMAATLWTQSAPAEAAGVVAHMPRGPRPADVAFRVAGQPAVCRLQDARAVRARCTVATRRVRTATLDARGRLRTCEITARDGCAAALAAATLPTLHLEKTVIVGRFRCTSRRRGLRCTVVGSGRGFVIDRGGIHRIAR